MYKKDKIYKNQEVTIMVQFEELKLALKELEPEIQDLE